MADETTIILEGKAYKLDDFELGELEWLEDELGGSLNDREVLGSMKAAVRLAYVIKRRDNPEFTLEDARKLKLSVFNDADEEAEPAAGKGKRPTQRGGA